MKLQVNRLFTLNIKPILYQSAIQNIINLALMRKPSYICFANVHMTVEAYQLPEFSNMVNQSTFTFADGMPLVFSLKALYKVKTDRVAGMDVMRDILKEAEKSQIKVFLFGSTVAVLEGIKTYITTSHPRLVLAGYISPPFRNISEEENNAIIQEMKNTGANLILVSLGCPKQEIWMAKNSHKVNACMLGVGGAFEIYAGKAQRAPRWLRNIGLEWFFRLLQNPGRLWKRYLTTNSIFIYLFFKQLLKRT